MPTTTIAIQLNGRDLEVPEGRSVAELVAELDLRPGMVAVEVNGSLVTRDRRESTVLRAGDLVELVTIMGGG
ncbi:MAG: sulfur carrier protein ThiS [Planctomycetota bacterium]